MAETNYIVLLLGDGDPHWREVPGGPFSAHNDRDAIKKAADSYSGELDDENPGATFVAVPTRSWHPRKMTVATKKVVSFEAAAPSSTARRDPDA